MFSKNFPRFWSICKHGLQKSLCNQTKRLYTQNIPSTINNRYVFKGIVTGEAVDKYLSSINVEYNELNTTNDNRSAQHFRRMELLKNILDISKERTTTIEYMQTLNNELKDAGQQQDKQFIEMIEDEKCSLNESLDKIEEDLLERICLLNEEITYSALIFEVTMGVGGKEAMLFAREIFDMYCGYIDYKGWDSTLLDIGHTELGGIRQASIMVNDEEAFDLLQYEAGVHRVQRIPSTEKSGRVHTSTVTVSVLPKPDDIDCNINEKDIKIETKRASGAGGQHVNTTDSAVRMVHLPTGVAVECQTERSQIKNKELAFNKLKAKLYLQQLTANTALQTATRKSQVGSSLRNEKIRTYNYSQDRITDHRLTDGGTLHNLAKFLEGGESLDTFINKLRYIKRNEKIVEIITNK